MEIFDLSKNFWKVHPQLKEIGELKKFYITNKEKNSSLLMWFIKFVYHPDSEFYEMEPKEKIRLISKDILNDENFYSENKEQIDFLVQEYTKIIDTVLDRTIRIIKDKLNEKNQFIADKDYDIETFEDLDKAILSYDKQLALLSKLEQEKSKKKVEGNAKGDLQLSEGDLGRI